MKCTVCSKEFVAERSTAKYCSGACRLKHLRKGSVTQPIVTVKDPRLCKEEGCNLRTPPNHGGRCIYHWRKDLDMPTIPEADYIELNKAQEVV
jgi:hypothetical protein